MNGKCLAKRITKFALVPLLVCGLNEAAVTKSQSELVSEGVRLKSAGSYSEAIRAFREALRIAESEGVRGVPLFEICDHLASTYAEAAQFSQAARQYRAALDLLKEIEGANSLDYAVVLTKAALLPGQGAPIEEAIGISERVLENRERGNPPKKILLLESNLAQIVIRNKSYRKAETILLQLRAALSSTPDEGEMLADSLTELGALRFNQGRFSEAADFYLDSLRAHEALHGGSHPHLVWPLNNLATAYAKGGRFNDASTLYD